MSQELAWQMVAMCFWEELCNLLGGWWVWDTWEPQSSLFALSSLHSLSQVAVWILPFSVYVLVLKKCWEVLVVDGYTRSLEPYSRVWKTCASLNLLSPGMLCWKCILYSCHSKQGRWYDQWSKGPLSSNHQLSLLWDNPTVPNIRELKKIKSIHSTCIYWAQTPW